MFPDGRFHRARTKREAMLQYDEPRNNSGTKKLTNKLVFLNLYTFLFIIFISLKTANSNTTNMNHQSGKNSVNSGNKQTDKLNKFDINSVQKDSPPDDYEDENGDLSSGEKYTNVNFDKNPFSEEFTNGAHIYNHERNGYSDFGDYKKFYLNPANPLPKSSVQFRISSKIVQTKYGKLQGIVLSMDEHRYLSPLEVFLGVPYATPPVGSNR